MKLQYRELEDDIRLIELSGKLDIYGVNEIDQAFVRHCAGDGVRVLVDLSGVSYISSIGIPMLINTAKSILKGGGKMALLSPQKNVAEVLNMTGIHLIIPIFHDLQSARDKLKTS